MEAELFEIEAEMKGVVGDQRLTCVQRRDQLSRFMARRGSCSLNIIAPGSSIVGRQQIVDVQEEFVESEAPERVSQRTVGIMKDIGSQLPEDQREGELSLKKTLFFKWSGRNTADRVQTRPTPSVWKPDCGVGSPVHQPLDSRCPCATRE